MKSITAKLQLLALIMGVMIITLPAVAATQLNLIQFSGDEGIDGFHRSTDNLQIKVEVQVDGDSVIENNQLRLVLADTWVNFNQCSPAGAVYECTYQRPVYSVSGIQEYTVQLFDDASKSSPTATPLAEEPFTLTVDGIKPNVESVSVSPAITQDGSVSISIRATDLALYDRPDICSGIETFHFSLNGNIPAGQASGEAQCFFNKAVQTTLTAPDGTYELCVFATDRVGYRSTEAVCDDVMIDTSAPQVVGLTFLYRGQETEFISTQDALVDLMLEFHDPNLISDSIRADLTKLNPLLSVQRPLKINQTHYKFANLNLRGFQQCLIGVTARDTLGNELDQEISCILREDGIPPQFIGYSTNLLDENLNYFVGRTTNLTIRFREGGSGLIKEDVFINLLNVQGLSNRNPDVCRKSGDIYLCSLEFTTELSDRPAAITVSTLTQDLVGNTLVEPAVLNLEIKTSPPIIYGFERVYISDADNFREGYLLPGDILELRINASNFNSQNVYGDFSIIGQDDHLAARECGYAGNDSICIFETTAEIAAEGFIPITFTGYNGETTVFDVEVKVYSDIDSEQPSFWTVQRTRCSPSPVDRSMSSFINYRLTCATQLLPLEPNTEIISVTFDKQACSGGIGDVADVNMYNPSSNPFFEVILHSKDFKKNSTTIHCPVYIMSLVGDQVTRHPEQLNITIEWDYYDNPYGTVGDQLVKKIERELDRVDDFAVFVEEAEKVMNYINKACQIKGLITGIIGVMDGVLGIMGVISAVLVATGYAADEGENLDDERAEFCEGTKSDIEKFFDDEDSSFDSGANIIFKLLDELCMLMNCASQKTDWGGTSTNFVQDAFRTGGGGIFWCQDINDYFESLGLSGVKVFDIKESLILSTACLCLPGIVRNLNKLMQVKCRYAVCMAEDVGAKGYPAYYCENEKNYNMCKYIYGEIFNLIPFAALIGDFVGMIKGIYQNPWQLLGTVVGLICKGLCEIEFNIAYELCILPKTLAKIGDGISTTEAMLDENYWTISDQYCSQARDIKIIRPRAGNVTGGGS